MSDLKTIQNNKGMGCQLLGLAHGPDINDSTNPDRRTVYTLDLAGGQTAVKAIWATMHSGGPMKVLGIGSSWRQYRGTGEKGAYLSFDAQPLPKVIHCVMTMTPKPEGDVFVISSLTHESKKEGLYDVLRLYTPFPVLREWAIALFELGVDKGLVQRLGAVGTIEWAHAVAAIGWDDVLDGAIKRGDIRMPRGSDG